MCVHWCLYAFSMRLDNDGDDDKDEDEDEDVDDEEAIVDGHGWRHRRRRRDCLARAEEERSGRVDRRWADGVYDWNGNGG